MMNRSMKRPGVQTLGLALTFVAGLVTADLLSRGHMAAPANAAATGGGIPDSGAQLQEIIDALKGENQRLDSIQATLDSGKMTVLTKSVDAKP